MLEKCFPDLDIAEPVFCLLSSRCVIGRVKEGRSLGPKIYRSWWETCQLQCSLGEVNGGGHVTAEVGGEGA